MTATANLSVPPVGADETPDQYERRVFGLIRDEDGLDDDRYDHHVRVTFADGRTYDGHPGGACELVSSIQAGRDEEFTAFCTDRPWFVFRTGEVADVAVARSVTNTARPADLLDEDDVHYRLPGSVTTLCGEDGYSDDTLTSEEAGAGTCPQCRAAADEEPLR